MTLPKFQIKKVTVRRAVKVTAGSYQNTDIDISIEANCLAKDAGEISAHLLHQVDKTIMDKLKEADLNVDLSKFGLTCYLD
jgi:hypothetical protein